MRFIRGTALGIAICLGACGDNSAPLDECATAKDDCVEAARCSDTEASFTCTCADGFEGDGRDPAKGGSGCANIDECAAGTDDCVAAATCRDSDGGYSCVLPPGYTGDGKSSGTGASDVDECADGTAACGSAAVCANTEGSYQCLGLFAPSAFRNMVYRLDPETYVTLESLRPNFVGEAVSGAVGFANDPLDGALWSVIKVRGGRSLATFDAMSGFYLELAPLPDRFASITFDAAGQLYGVTGNGASTPETLYQLDKVTGEATLVRALGAGSDGEVICFNPDDGKIYHWSGGTSFFESITMAEPYEVQSLSSSFNREVFGCTWDAVAKDFVVFDISSGARRFAVDGTFSGSNLQTFADDLRSPGLAAAWPHRSSPASGPEAGGTVILLEGSGFAALSTALGGADPTVSFGGATATGAIIDDHRMTVTAPAGVAGPVDLTIEVGQLRYRWRDGFTYLAAP